MPSGQFFNRNAELAALERGWTRERGLMTMVYGRRRLGKTYLLQQFFSNSTDKNSEPKRYCYYLAEQSTAELQRLALAERLLDAFPGTGASARALSLSWNTLLNFATQQVANGERFALILDEFPYLVSQSPELPSTIQAWWDQKGVYSSIFTVLCGSQLSVMSALGKETAPLFGRFDGGILRIPPLRYDDVAKFYEGKPHYGVKEKLLMFGVFGGTPRYHAMVDTDMPWRDEVVALLMRPGSPLESEIRFLLSSEQIRDPAPYNAVLNAIAHGRTQFSGIQQATGLDSSVLAHPLRVLQELEWIVREFPMGETSDRRALYQISDPFLHFWYRFVAPLSSTLQFSDPMRVFESHVEPFLADHMGWKIFEGVCVQWLQKHASTKLSLTINQAGRYWSRDGKTEIDIVADLYREGRLFGECKWSENRVIGPSMLAELKAKVESLPVQYRSRIEHFVLFSVGGFSPELRDLATKDPCLHLIDGPRLLETADH